MSVHRGGVSFERMGFCTEDGYGRETRFLYTETGFLYRILVSRENPPSVDRRGIRRERMGFCLRGGVLSKPLLCVQRMGSGEKPGFCTEKPSFCTDTRFLCYTHPLYIEGRLDLRGWVLP